MIVDGWFSPFLQIAVKSAAGLFIKEGIGMIKNNRYI